MIEGKGVRETICSKCVHGQVCAYKERYLKMLSHLNEEFVLFMTEENRNFMQFNDPACKWKEEKLDVMPFMNNQHVALRDPDDVFGSCRYEEAKS